MVLIWSSATTGVQKSSVPGDLAATPEMCARPIALNVGAAGLARALADRRQSDRFGETDHSEPRHAIAWGIDYLELEIRQDLIATPDQQARWAEALAGLLARIAI